MTYFLAVADEAQEAIERVRELHEPIENLWLFKGQMCGHCSDIADSRFYMYPCLTIQALDGYQND